MSSTFERLLSSLSATFIQVSAEDVDGQIELGLEQLVKFLNIDRSSLAQFSPGGQELLVTHSYTLPGHAPMPRIDLAAIWPWYTDQLRQGKVLRFVRLPQDLPPEAVAEREFYRRGGLPRSHLAIPFQVGEAVLGGIGLGSFREEIHWPEELVGRISLVATVFANALARKVARQKSAQMHEQLTLAGRVALLGEMAAAIAHEVNQPLCALVSNADALKSLFSSNASDTDIDLDEVRSALDDIVRDSGRASAVLARVRALFQRTPTAHGLVDINAILREVLDLLRGDLARHETKVLVDLTENLPLVMGDRVGLQQVVVNLLNNGREAMHNLPPQERQLLVRSTLEDEGILVTITDTGMGIPQDTLARIFDTFFTTKTGGLGMGLAVCRSILTDHGGRIWAVSQEGQGTTIEFLLPVSREGTP